MLSVISLLGKCMHSCWMRHIRQQPSPGVVVGCWWNQVQSRLRLQPFICHGQTQWRWVLTRLGQSWLSFLGGVATATSIVVGSPPVTGMCPVDIGGLIPIVGLIIHDTFTLSSEWVYSKFCAGVFLMESLTQLDQRNWLYKLQCWI